LCIVCGYHGSGQADDAGVRNQFQLDQKQHLACPDVHVAGQKVTRLNRKISHVTSSASNPNPHVFSLSLSHPDLTISVYCLSTE